MRTGNVDQAENETFRQCLLNVVKKVIASRSQTYGQCLRARIVVKCPLQTRAMRFVSYHSLSESRTAWWSVAGGENAFWNSIIAGAFAERRFSEASKVVCGECTFHCGLCPAGAAAVTGTNGARAPAAGLGPVGILALLAVGVAGY